MKPLLYLGRSLPAPDKSTVLRVFGWPVWLTGWRTR